MTCIIFTTNSPACGTCLFHNMPGPWKLPVSERVTGNRFSATRENRMWHTSDMVQTDQKIMTLHHDGLLTHPMKVQVQMCVYWSYLFDYCLYDWYCFKWQESALQSLAEPFWVKDGQKWVLFRVLSDGSWVTNLVLHSGIQFQHQ